MRAQRPVTPLAELAVPFEFAGIEAVAQDFVDGADRHGTARAAINQPGTPRLFRRFFQGQRAGRIPAEQMRDDRAGFRVNIDDVLAVRASHVAVAKGRFGRPDALLGLFLLPLARFLRQVVDVVLGHQHLDAVDEFF